MKVNLAKNLKLTLTEIMSDHFKMEKNEIINTLTDDDAYYDWLDSNWSIIKDFHKLDIRDFMTWSYLMDTESGIPVDLEYYFDVSE